MQKTVLKSIVNALLDDKQKLYMKDKVRALFVILQNPVFCAQSSYTVLAHVLRHVTALPNPDHQMLVHWFRTYVSCKSISASAAKLGNT